MQPPYRRSAHREAGENRADLSEKSYTGVMPDER